MLKLLSLIGSVIDKTQKDHVTAFSAQTAFFTVLSFFPFVIAILALMRFFPITPTDLIHLAKYYLPEQYSSSLIAIINSLYGRITTFYMSFTVITLFWSASKGILAIANGLNTIHEIEEKRNYFVLRFISSIYIAIISIAVLVGLVALLFGNTLLNQLFTFEPVLENQRLVFTCIRFVISFSVFFLVFISVYRFLPSENLKFKEVLPGALFSTIGWMVLSLFFSLYFDNFKFFSIMYGGLTSILLTLFWLYFCMMCLFIGAEINQFFIVAKKKKNVRH
ncbi:MAG: YihY/virulence factor BrkB family protein [Anaerostipes sp.]|nr:YihY/virulence factor BrkB family protein [Anaerostipes sp.]